MTKVNAIEVAPTSSNTKPSNGETLITLVLDETGSMNSCWDSTISSVNDYLGSQKSAPGVANASLFKFSETGYGYARTMNAANAIPQTGLIRTVFENRPIADVEVLTRQNYVPNGNTNLYDAIGSTIRRVEAQLAGLESVPSVLVVIVTDGGENASKEFKLADVKSLVAAKEAEGWTFIYLGANQDAWAVGQSFGLSKGQTMTYDTTQMANTMGTLASATTAYRGMRSSGAVAANAVAKDFFSGEEDQGEI